MAITVNDPAVTIESDESMLAKVQAKIVNILETAQSYSIVGSRFVVNPLMTALLKQERLLKRKILYRKGYSGANHPDFRRSTDTNDNVDNI